MDDIVYRLRHPPCPINPGQRELVELMSEAAAEIEHFRVVYGHITPDQAAKIKQFQASMAEFSKQFPDKGAA